MRMKGHGGCESDCVVPCYNGECYLTDDTADLLVWLAVGFAVAGVLLSAVISCYKRSHGYVRVRGCCLCAKWERPQSYNVRVVQAQQAQQARQYTPEPQNVVESQAVKPTIVLTDIYPPDNSAVVQ